MIGDMIRRLIGCGLLLAGILSADDSEINVQFKDLPPAIQRAAREQSKGATVRGYSKEIEDGKTRFEVETRIAGKNRDVLLDESGAVIEIEQQIDLASVPPPAMAGLKRRASGAGILSVESVTRGSNVSYEAVVSKGGRKREIAVDANGHPAKPE